MRAAMQALEQVAGEIAVRVKQPELPVGLLRVDACFSELDEKRRLRVRHLPDVVPPNPTQERCGIRAVVQPVLWLPAKEARRLLRDNPEHGLRDIGRNSPADIGELGRALGASQPTCRCAVGNAPETQDLGLPTVDWPLVLEAGRLAAKVTRLI